MELDVFLERRRKGLISTKDAYGIIRGRPVLLDPQFPHITWNSCPVLRHVGKLTDSYSSAVSNDLMEAVMSILIDTMDMYIGMPLFNKLFKSNERIKRAHILDYCSKNSEKVVPCTCDKFIALVSNEDPEFQKSICFCEFSSYLAIEKNNQFMPSPSDHSYRKLCATKRLNRNRTQ